jgi:multidrug efflux pump subunit AcrA (membrane-fusion protein)
MLTIPRAAVIQSDGKSAVFVLDGSRIQLKPIEVGREMGEKLEVATGLGPNDRIVVRGLEGLSSGQRVRVKQGS